LGNRLTFSSTMSTQQDVHADGITKTSIER